MKALIRQNKVSTAIILFLVLFYFVHWLKPAIIYTKNGSFREFGLGYRHKTVLPIWVFSILLGILSYLGVNIYLQTDFN
jgi:hypothetical protein